MQLGKFGLILLLILLDGFIYGQQQTVADDNISQYYLKMYVASGKIHFIWKDDTALTMVIDVTIGGQSPVNVT